MSRDGLGLSKLLWVAGAVGVVLVVTAGVLLLRERHVPAQSEKPAAAAPKPSVYCDFYDFTRARVVVSFDFAVDGLPARPVFTERAIVEPDGTRTAFDAGTEPVWSHVVEDGTPQITSPDGETRIVLYGLQPNKGGVFWTEAGLRSNRFRNLEGKCRQAYLAEGRNAAKGASP